MRVKKTKAPPVPVDITQLKDRIFMMAVLAVQKSGDDHLNLSMFEQDLHKVELPEDKPVAITLTMGTGDLMEMMKSMEEYDNLGDWEPDNPEAFKDALRAAVSQALDPDHAP